MSAPRTQRGELLAWVAGLGAVSASALSARNGLSPAAARATLAAAAARGELTRWPGPAGEPALYAVTRAGIRTAGESGLSPVRVTPGAARHAAACCAVAAALEGAYPQAEVLGEPALRREQAARGRPLAELPHRPLAGGSARSHRPDLLLLRGAGVAPVAVEVELTAKSPERLAGICLAWARSRQVGGVLYVVDGPAGAAVRRAVAASRAQRRVSVVALQALLGGGAGAGGAERPPAACAAVRSC